MIDAQVKDNTAEIARLGRRLEIMERLFDDLLLELGQEVIDNMISRNRRKIAALDADIAEIVASISLIETGGDNAGF